LLTFCWLLARCALAQQLGQGLPGTIGLNSSIRTSNVDIYVKGPNGKPVNGVAVVTLINLSGQAYRQENAVAGHARFSEVAATQYKVLVIAPGFERETLTVDVGVEKTVTANIQLRAMSAEDASLYAGIETLPAKVQKELGKAMSALNANKPAEARSHLETANRIAPKSAEVNYLLGMYSSRSKDVITAKSYWTRTLELNPNHLLALLSLGEALLREDKAGDALPYLKRAVEAGPTAWRAHAFLADAELRQGATDEAIRQAERALELGHGQAENVQPFLAGALARRGEKERAIALLQSYLKDHSADTAAVKELESIQSASVSNGEAGADGNGVRIADDAMVNTTALQPISNWLPPDVDEMVPAVEAGVSCKIEDVLRKTEKRIEEFVGNVDRFAATELVTHESINKWGLASSPEQRKFDYLVSVEEGMPGFLNVNEYRSSHNSTAVDFPGGIETHGLPALVLIFHPYNTGNFEMTCEGLTRWNGELAWQMHFRQRSDKPNRIRAYKMGSNGPSYPIALKGRAWIAANTFQIMRLETDLVAPVRQIRLVADHTAIEYGPVYFKNRNVDMWLPQSAEVYFEWRARRIHRRHSFNKYVLFAVDDKQRISAPKAAQESGGNPPSASEP
jgi:tetratricopeptide (TPR) repeat protein